MAGVSSFIQDLLTSAITEYLLLAEKYLNQGFSIFIARLDFVIYVFIEDKIGLHCVEWFETAGEVEEKVQYWTNRLESGILKTQTFNIPPDSLKSRTYTLQPKDNSSKKGA